ncbi:EamA/RhaT family transporter [Salmonella enterica subsp. enterica serovar Wilhelmsburg]|uniref:Threonine/homoserine exporter RhtA n=1 Tax=Salmonella enterica subsp. enterica serovar Wilhelmsburg TaxID=1960126 RepID=A0A659Q3U1_SALET|nr:DMT family transporter [Salmonella enterica]TGC64041.1 EamA/RhaT family transporter [Salmonella enterica subsp. enterica serovar Wilhelmsburg]TGC73278.1 EamA/RhaT family transporter [Salmonella enterica subsp. enterica serovar Wilhelmsburg]TGC80016.1 EamA/RhaT family transporter [Salmonella enterica subsp. enterica serovar Wilhelmsburg]TGC88270.1 EamA/RhaT family transporter [Salmonella enterica subsp. enterica serovar Wilhelmsburg]TGC90334.1 EamA/RhaT family transporter [Salmonella enteric
MPYLLLALAAVFWGGNYVIGHVLVSNANPLLLSEFRWLLTAILLLTLYHSSIKKDWKNIKSSLPVILFLAVFGQVLFPLTLYVGLQYTNSLNAAIYMSATPCMVLCINRFIFRDHISYRNCLGVAASTIGVIFLVLQGHILNLSALGNLNKGDLWAMGSALSWALYCSFLRLKNRNISGNSFVAVSSVIGAVIIIPVAVYGFLHDPHFTVSQYLNGGFLSGLIYLVIFPSWLSYVFWNRGILDIGATRGEIFTHIIPLSGGLLSIVFLGTQLHYYHLVSAVLISVGIFLCSRHKAKVNQALTDQGN